MSSLVLLAVPLFVFLGLLIEMTGMARAMVAFLAALLGHVRGGLYYVLLGAIYLVSGISGSKAADMAAVAPVLFPEMKRRGSDEGEMIAILVGLRRDERDHPAQPGADHHRFGHRGIHRRAVHRRPAARASCSRSRWRWWPGGAHAARRRGRRRRAARCCARFAVAFPALLLPFVIRTAVVKGIATATEVSTIGIAYAVAPGLLGLLLSRLRGWHFYSFDWRRIAPMLLETAALSGAILFIIGTATGMAWALTQSGFSRQLAAFMATMPGGWFGYMLISIVAFVVLGSVLEGIPAIVLFGPLLFPIARQVGIHEVHYAMVVILAMGIGLFAPPLGVGLLRGLRHRAGVAGRRHAADLALSRRAADRAAGGRRDSVDFDRIFVKARPRGGAPLARCQGFPDST